MALVLFGERVGIDILILSAYDVFKNLLLFGV